MSLLACVIISTCPCWHASLLACVIVGCVIVGIIAQGSPMADTALKMWGESSHTHTTPSWGGRFCSIPCHLTEELVHCLQSKLTSACIILLMFYPVIIIQFWDISHQFSDCKPLYHVGVSLYQRYFHNEQNNTVGLSLLLWNTNIHILGKYPIFFNP